MLDIDIEPSLLRAPDPHNAAYTKMRHVLKMAMARAKMAKTKLQIVSVWRVLMRASRSLRLAANAAVICVLFST